MSRTPWLLIPCTILTLGVLSRPTAGQQAAIPAEVSSVLRQAGFLEGDLTALEAGRVITHTETSPERLEASVATAVRIATTGERALAYFHQLISYVDGQVTLAYGTFGRPPRDSDVGSLSLDPADVTDLRACQPSLCDVRIGAATPAEISRALDWYATDATQRGNAWMRQGLASYAADYVQRGDAALVTFDERGARVDLQAQWRDIIERSTALATLAPNIQRYLSTGPSAPVPGATDVVYWDKQHYTGLKPIIGITHLITWPDPSQPGRTVIVQRQVHASHYLYGALAVTLILQDRRDTSAPATYVVYFNRSRGDLLKPPPPQTQGGLRARVSGLSASLGANLQRRLGSELIGQSAERLMSSMKQALER